MKLTISRTKSDAGVTARGTRVITEAMRAAAVRPPRLTGKPVTGRYGTAYGQNIRRGLFVSRADVARYMLWAVDQPATFGQTVGSAN